MKIVFCEPTGRGGICHYTYQLAESLARGGSDVLVLTTEAYELEGRARTFAVHSLVKKSRIKRWLTRGRSGGAHRANTAGPTSRGPSTARPARRHLAPAVRFVRTWAARVSCLGLLLARRPDIVHLQWPLNLSDEYQFIRLLKLLRFRVVYTAHNLLPHDSDSARERRACERIYRAVDRVVVHGERNRAELMAEFGIEGRKIAVIPHGAYEMFSEDGGIAKSVARRKLGIPEDSRVVLFFGAIRRYKGLEHLLDAFERIQQEVERPLLVIVGQVNTGAEEPDRYARLIGRFPSDRVRFVDAYVPSEEVAPYFVAADVVALPYVKTYQSGVVFLAYANGRPVVATDTGALGEAVEAGKSGMLVPPEDAKSLAAALAAVLNDPDRRERMGHYAKHLSDTRYSWDRIGGMTTELYRSVIHER